MGRQVNPNVPEDGYISKEQFGNTGSIAQSDFAVVADKDNTRKIVFDASAQATGTKLTISAGNNSSDVVLTLPAASGTLVTSATDGGITQLTGDVTAGPGNGSQAATVASVGTSTAANVHAAELLANAATAANTVSTIVKRDSSGNFAAGTVTANLTGNASGTAANVTGTVAIANGGTGQITAPNAINALLPSQTSQSGKFLTTDGSVSSWGAAGGGGSPGGSDTQIQYNDATAFAGDSTYTFNKTTKAVTSKLVVNSPTSQSIANGGIVDTSQTFNKLFISATDVGDPSIQTTTTVADVSGNLNSKYWLHNTWFGGQISISTPFESARNLAYAGRHYYYIWYNVNGAGVDPSASAQAAVNALVGDTTYTVTGIEVAVATDATAIEVATATKTELDTKSSEFATSRVNAELTLTSGSQVNGTQSLFGSIPNPDDAGNSGFTCVNTDPGTDPTYVDVTLSTTQAFEDGVVQGQILILNISTDTIPYGGTTNTLKVNSIQSNVVIDNSVDTGLLSIGNIVTFIWSAPYWLQISKTRTAF